MKEKDLRQVHRTVGIILAFFIIVQSTSGLILNIGDMFDKHWEIFHVIHYSFNHIGGIYRIILGLGLLGMSLSGITIFLKIRARRKSSTT